MSFSWYLEWGYDIICFNVIVTAQTVMFDPKHFKLLINFCRLWSNVMIRYFSEISFWSVLAYNCWFFKMHVSSCAVWGQKSQNYLIFPDNLCFGWLFWGLSFVFAHYFGWLLFVFSYVVCCSQIQQILQELLAREFHQLQKMLVCLGKSFQILWSDGCLVPLIHSLMSVFM